jgi:hypothetical protein
MYGHIVLGYSASSEILGTSIRVPFLDNIQIRRRRRSDNNRSGCGHRNSRTAQALSDEIYCSMLHLIALGHGDWIFAVDSPAAASSSSPVSVDGSQRKEPDKAWSASQPLFDRCTQTPDWTAHKPRLASSKAACSKLLAHLR